jgi:hypothetical protein
MYFVVYYVKILIISQLYYIYWYQHTNSCGSATFLVLHFVV